MPPRGCGPFSCGGAPLGRPAVAGDGDRRRARAARSSPRGVPRGTRGSGRLVALEGRSGSGGTTLLNIVGGLDIPDQGRVEAEGRDLARLARLGQSGLLRPRRDRSGFVVRSFGPGPLPTTAENVGVPLRSRTRPSGPGSCPAAGSGGSPSHGPPPTGRRCSSPTSRPAGSTARPGTPSWSRCGRRPQRAVRRARLRSRGGTSSIRPVRSRAGPHPSWSPRMTRPCWTRPAGCRELRDGEITGHRAPARRAARQGRVKVARRSPVRPGRRDLRP